MGEACGRGGGGLMRVGRGFGGVDIFLGSLVVMVGRGKVRGGIADRVV